MNKFLPIFFLFILTLPLSGQRLHTPDDVVKIMEESTIKYVFDSLTTKMEIPNYDKNGQLELKLIRIDDLGEIKLEDGKPQYSKKQLKRIKKGDKSILKKKYEKARDCYSIVYDEKPSETDIINKMAKTYLKEKDFASAAFWYERSVEINFIDSEARRNLAICHMEMGQLDLAVEQITYAHLFNRNNQDIEEVLIKIYKNVAIHYSNEFFTPIYQIKESDDKKSIMIFYGHSVWAAYAAVEALWKYEPDYDVSMKQLSNQKKNMVMKKEALMNALLTYERLAYQNKKEYFPLMHLLSDISLKKQIDNFVIYEIISKEDPLYILSLDSDKLDQLKNYLLIYRSTLN